MHFTQKSQEVSAFLKLQAWLSQQWHSACSYWPNPHAR
jgi:hypothetical protein